MAVIDVTWSGLTSVSSAASVVSDVIDTAGSVGFSVVITGVGASGGISGDLEILVGDSPTNLNPLAGSSQTVLVGSGQTLNFSWSEGTFYAYAAVAWYAGGANGTGTFDGVAQVVTLETPPVIIPPSTPIAGPPGGITQETNTQQLAVNRLRQRLLASPQVAKPNVSALLQAICNQYDKLEAVFQQLFYYRQLANAYGQMLDDIGALVEFPRPPDLPTPSGDDTYRLYLQAKIRADNSSGTTEDLNAIFDLIVPSGVTFQVFWQYTAAFMIYLTDPGGVLTQTEIDVFAFFMEIARAAGVRGVLEYSIDTPDSELFSFMSATDTFDVNGSGPTNQGIGFDQGYFRGATN